MPTFDATTGMPLVAKNGKPADGCGCCEAPPACCPILCGDTPAYIDVVLQTDGFAAWFNAIGSEYEYRHRSFNDGTEPSEGPGSPPTPLYGLAVFECQTDFAQTVRCFPTSTDGSCTWNGQVRMTGAFSATYTRGSGEVQTRNIDGYLIVSVGFSKRVALDGTVTIIADHAAYFKPDREGSNGDFSLQLGHGDYAGVAEGDGEYSYAANTTIIGGYYYQCPMTLHQFPENQFRAHNFNLHWLNGHLKPVWTFGALSPGGAELVPGPATCKRTDCSGDCGGDTTYCPDPDALRECIGCTEALIVITSDTDAGFSKFDFFTYGDAVSVLVIDDPYSETTASGFENIGYGSYGNVWASLICTGKKANGRWGWQFEMSGSETSDAVRNYLVTASFETDTACPPSSFSLTEFNAQTWDVPDGVTYINFSIGC